MRAILKSCFGKNDKEYFDHLNYILDKNQEYNGYGLDILDKYLFLNCLGFMIAGFENAGQFPSENLFLISFPKMPKDSFDSSIPVLPIEDFHVYTANFVCKRINKAISEEMKTLTGEIAVSGMTQEISDRIDELKKLSGKIKAPDIQLRQSSRDNYAERLKKLLGMQTGVARLDELIGGMDAGTVSVIAGFTGHYKTMFAVNIARLNAYNNGYNIAYLSLETPKDTMYDQLLSRHSYEMKFPLYNFIAHQKIQRCTLTQQEYDYLFDVIEPDLYEPYYNKEKDKDVKRGLVVFFDQSDFDTFSFEEITNTLEALDDKLNGYLDAVIVDYAQLCKFGGSGGQYAGDTNGIINSYVAFFRKLAHGFRSGAKKKKLIVILLSQINREAWKKASRKFSDDEINLTKDKNSKTKKKLINDSEGHYDLTCLADANELERGASRVITTYTSDLMKIVSEAQVQLLKNRSGATMTEPDKVLANPEAYVYGEESSSLGQTFSGYTQQTNHATLANGLSSLDGSKDMDNRQVEMFNEMS